MARLMLAVCFLRIINANRIPSDIEDDLKQRLEESPSSGEDSLDLVLAEFPAEKDFFFGLATAAAHVEVAAPNDPWVKFAEESNGGVAAYKNPNEIDPRLRLKFDVEPDVEINLTRDTGVSVFRMGVDWGRLVPQHPEDYAAKKCGWALEHEIEECRRQHLGVQNTTAMTMYKQLAQKVKAAGMKLMMTLFHHSIPAWSADRENGWQNNKTIEYFLAFAKDVALELNDDVHYWVTFNEPHVFILMVHCVGLWPPGEKPGSLNMMKCLSTEKGYWHSKTNQYVSYVNGMRNIIDAHKGFYTWAKASLDIASIGVAHNVAYNKAVGGMKNIIAKNLVETNDRKMKLFFIDEIHTHIDWLGLNYYAKETIGVTGLIMEEDEEYSDSGRGVFPDGLFYNLMQFHYRYLSEKPVPIIITENGVADESDVMRPSYIVEHLLAVREAMRHGVNVLGYVHWTVSDNWEWADGYCPKFGLVAVDRSTPELTRTPRGSYYFYKQIVETRKITVKDRTVAWAKLQDAVLSNQIRPFCRASDAQTGLDTSFDEQRKHRRNYVPADWRFTGLSQAEDACFRTAWKPVEKRDIRRGVMVQCTNSCARPGGQQPARRFFGKVKKCPEPTRPFWRQMRCPVVKRQEKDPSDLQHGECMIEETKKAMNEEWTAKQLRKAWQGCYEDMVERKEWSCYNNECPAGSMCPHTEMSLFSTASIKS